MLSVCTLSKEDYAVVSDNLGIDVAECLSLCEFCKDDGNCYKQEEAADVVAKYQELNSIGG